MEKLGTNIQQAALILEKGGLVSIPTETVYGLAANALDAMAVAKIFEAKGRPVFNPVIVHLPSVEEIDKYTLEFPAPLRALAHRFWPGPLTLLLKKNDRIPDIVTAGLPLVGIRIPDHSLTTELLRQLPFPVAAPSANLSNRVSPTSADAVMSQLGDRVDYILDGGLCRVGIESTIVGLIDGKVTIVRPGGVTQEEIESVVGTVTINESKQILAPGSLEKHYSPTKPFFLLNQTPPASDRSRIGLIVFSNNERMDGFGETLVLSPTGDLREAAHRLFALLREIEGSKMEAFWAREVPKRGLGVAINDRLRRAAAGREA